ncbi:hypothetical protein [Streptomyces sp. CA-111067]|uniref:hypothetical protein n=1 Tax=Streptomyces sp. CA-111067 TaxID=3240046 RepID=UPI003D96587A
MLVTVEAVQEGVSTPASVRVHSKVGTAVALWMGPVEATSHEHHVEWTVDEDIAWTKNAGPATSATSALWEAGDRIVFRGRLTLTEDGAAILELGGTLILLDLADPPPPDDADGSWIEFHAARDNVSVYPYQL